VDHWLFSFLTIFFMGMLSKPLFGHNNGAARSRQQMFSVVSIAIERAGQKIAENSRREQKKQSKKKSRARKEQKRKE